VGGDSQNDGNQARDCLQARSAIAGGEEEEEWQTAGTREESECQSEGEGEGEGEGASERREEQMYAGGEVDCIRTEYRDGRWMLYS